MLTPMETVRNFYAAIATADSEKMISLMAPDVEWISAVIAMQAWESFSPAPSEISSMVRPSFHWTVHMRSCGDAQARRPAIRARVGRRERKDRASPPAY